MNRNEPHRRAAARPAKGATVVTREERDTRQRFGDRYAEDRTDVVRLISPLLPIRTTISPAKYMTAARAAI